MVGRIVPDNLELTVFVGIAVDVLLDEGELVIVAVCLTVAVDMGVPDTVLVD